MHQERDYPLFSIVVPTYNTGEIIDETISSLINQKFNSFEVIVIDDGSTDDTVKRLQKYKNKIKILRQTNKGSTFARNFGISKARGEYIVSFDHDDLLFPYALTVYKEVIKYFNFPPLIFSKHKSFNKNIEMDLSLWSSSKIDCIEFQDYFRKNITSGLINSILIIKKETIIKVGGYRPNNYSYDDHDLVFRLGIESPMIMIRYPVTVGYRFHGGNLSRDNDYNTKGAFALIKNERNQDYPGGNKRKFDRRGIIGTGLLSNIYYYHLLNKNSPLFKRLVSIAKVILKARSMLILGLIRKIRSPYYGNNVHQLK